MAKIELKKDILVKQKAQEDTTPPDKPEYPRMNFAKEITDIKSKIKGFHQRLNEVLPGEDVTPDIDKEINFELMNGITRKGIFKGVTKFQMLIEEDGIVKKYMKHAIMCYWM